MWFIPEPHIRTPRLPGRFLEPGFRGIRGGEHLEVILVALDYSTPAHLTNEAYDELVRAATWPS